ncbi:hypothetical protein ACVW04_006303 [Bradyrhizobium sp. LM2.3]
MGVVHVRKSRKTAEFPASLQRQVRDDLGGVAEGEGFELLVRRVAVAVEPVSADSLCETGAFRETAGDFPPFSPEDCVTRSLETEVECKRSPDFRAREAQVANFS